LITQARGFGFQWQNCLQLDRLHFGDEPIGVVAQVRGDYVGMSMQTSFGDLMPIRC